MKKTFSIEVDCALCAAKCEEAIKKTDDVIACTINFITQKMIFEAADSNFDATLKKAIKAAKKIEPDFEAEI